MRLLRSGAHDDIAGVGCTRRDDGASGQDQLTVVASFGQLTCLGASEGAGLTLHLIDGGLQSRDNTWGLGKLCAAAVGLVRGQRVLSWLLLIHY